MIFILLPFKNKIYYNLDNLSTHGQWTYEVKVSWSLILLLHYLPKNMTFSPKIVGRKKVVKILFHLFED